MNSDKEEEEYYQHRQLVESDYPMVRRRVETDNMHTGSGHSFLNPTTNNLSEKEEAIKCDPKILTESEMLHCNLAAEADADDSSGKQGGQDWQNPTFSPTLPPQVPSQSPSTSTEPSGSPTSVPSFPPTIAPTDSPTLNPTVRGDPFVLLGQVWYDRNANGQRDSNIDDPVMGQDLEYQMGLGGVSITLQECDPKNNMAIDMSIKYGEGKNNHAMTTSRGYDVNYRPQLSNKKSGGGKWNMINIKAEKSYFVYLSAPPGYSFSEGVCNDNVPGHECPHTSASIFAYSYRKKNRFLLRGSDRRRLQRSPPPSDAASNDILEPTEDELELGVTEGRSIKCVAVDRTGMPDGRIDVGVFRFGDVSFAKTKVDLKLDLIRPDVVYRRLQEGNISLLDLDQDNRVLQSEMVQVEGYSYDLTLKDKESIGKVTSEVLASNLDRQLLKNGVVLDTVSHLEVSYFAPEDSASSFAQDTSDTTGQSKRRNGGKLAVNLLVRGHYNRDLNVDFDYVVQDSINRQTHAIRRQLTMFNQNCRDQTTKIVDQGFSLDDFLEVHTSRGVKKPLNRGKRAEQQQAGIVQDEEVQAFSSACDQDALLPDYFEASLGGFKLQAPTEASMSAEGGSSSSPGAIIGVIVAVTLFALGIGYLLFQHGLKKKQEKAREVKVTHLATRHVGDEDFHLDEVDEKISKDAKEKSKSKGMINGKTKKKIDKKSSAEGDSTGDTKSGPQNSENDKEALLEINKEYPDSEFDKIAESVAVATRTKKRRQANTTNKLKSSLTRRRRNCPNKLKASLTNAAPKIVQMEFDESSDDESSSSSEEEEDEEEEGSSSSSDSDSSSSSEGSESSSQIKARKRREKRIAADKKKSTSTKGKKTRPRRSNTNTKQRQKPSRPSRSNNIV